MWLILIFFIFILNYLRADVSSNYFCADMTPQPHINIEQLMGMWYGIEIINHNLEEEHYVRIVPSCPIIHISEVQSSFSDYYSPLHRDYNYGYNYGERRTYNNPRYPYYDNTYRHPASNPRDYYNRKNYEATGYIKMRSQDMKRIRIWWDENGTGTEYLLRYNLTRPGFWFSSGPHNGSDLEPQYSHFAGTIQVLKAVGNHLVLTFCHQLPDRQLFTILLSRENKLDFIDIHGVHNLLNRKGLSTNNIRKVCNRGTKLSNSKLFLLLWFLFVILKF